MGHLSRPVGLRALGLVLAAVASLSCGDALIVVGDQPGIVRIAAGIPDLPGDSIGATATETHLSTPSGVAADAALVYIADSDNSRILGITSAGVVNIFVNHKGRTEEPRIRAPAGVALDGQGGLYFADPDGDRLWRLDIATVEVEVIAGTGARGGSPDGTAALAADLDTPTGIALGPDGLIYFTETGASLIRRIEADGTITTFGGNGFPGGAGDGLPALEASFFRPSGLAFGPGALYVADTNNHRIRRIDLSTTVVSTIAGTGGRGFSGDGELSIQARLDRPEGVAFSTNRANLFIADTGNNRVRVVNLATNVITTFIGNGATEFNGDLMPASETALNAPTGVAVSPLDILYLADSAHHLVRRTSVGFLTAQ